MQTVITAVGPDNRGLADPIIHYVTGEGANIAEIQMYDHDEEAVFAMLCRIEISPERFSALKDAMQQRGYKLVSKDQNPDLGVSISRVYNTYTGVISYPSYWGYYNSYWDPYYWGYPGYGYDFPYAYEVYQISEGALSIDIVDLKDANNNKKIKGLWNGLIRGEGVFNSNNVNSQIKALFDQSPYIKTN